MATFTETSHIQKHCIALDNGGDGRVGLGVLAINHLVAGLGLGYASMKSMLFHQHPYRA